MFYSGVAQNSHFQFKNTGLFCENIFALNILLQNTL